MLAPSHNGALPEPDATVVGAGPAGLAAAMALAHQGIATTLIGPPPTPDTLRRETRTTALFGGSIELLKHLGCWSALQTAAAPLKGLRLIDDTGGLLRAPETLFQAAELGRDAFGYNVENARLTAVLYDAASENSRIRLLTQAVTEVRPDTDRVTLLLSDGSRHASRLIVGADGRNSRCRAAAGATTEAWSYPQVAVATRFNHSRPHGDVSTELHRRAGPLTTVPMPGKASSLVWVETPAEARRLMELDDASFALDLEARLGGLLGSISDLGPRASFPLSGLTAKPMARNRIMLIGEAGHVLPPIGAQGLNLGFRDAAWVAHCAGEAKAGGGDIGGDAVVAAYIQARTGDVASRTLAVDLLNRSLLAGLLPADLARGVGLVALGAMPWLRRIVMQAGLGPGGPEPALLRSSSY